MAPANRKPRSPVQAPTAGGGLFRTTLAGPGRSLAEAFASIERAPQVERIWRHEARDLLGARVRLSPEEGEGYWELIRIRQDIFIILEDFAYKNPRFELVPGDGLVQFNFKLSGDMTLAVSRFEPLRWNRPSVLVWGQPAGIDIGEWTAPGAHERIVSISIRPQFLREHFLSTFAEVPERLEAFVSGDRRQISYCQLPMSAHLFERTTRLIENPFTGPLALIYTEGLTLELLCNAVASFGSSPALPVEEYTERELRRLHDARDILTRELSAPPTGAKLARRVGMAESSLMRGFKAVFGETMFDFSLRCRMQRALQLLREGKCSVAKAAEAVGYAHSTSFATAFRRHFGMRPIEVRRVKSTRAGRHKGGNA
jgi:AraC-like DNA-binding protein